MLVLAGLLGLCGVSVSSVSMGGGATEGSAGGVSSAGDRLMRLPSVGPVVSIVGGLLYGAEVDADDRLLAARDRHVVIFEELQLGPLLGWRFDLLRRLAGDSRPQPRPEAWASLCWVFAVGS